MGTNYVQGDYFVLGKGRPRRWPAVIVAAGLVAGLAFLPTAALADKGGKGNGKGNTATATATVATVTASPNPAGADSSVYVGGCGYEFEPVQIHILHSAGYTEDYAAGMWAAGCFGGYFVTSEAGTYTIQVYQSSSGSPTLKASTTLTVTP